MKIILKENVANLGYKDDVVEVKDGYGRNYLIPQGKAVIANASALKQLAEDQKQRAHKIAKMLEDAKAAAAALEGVALTIATKTSATGTIFGSVGAIQIAEALEKLGHNVDRKLISIKETVKEVGNYSATVKFHKEVSVEIPFEVVAEYAPASRATHIPKGGVSKAEAPPLLSPSPVCSPLSSSALSPIHTLSRPLSPIPIIPHRYVF